MDWPAATLEVAFHPWPLTPIDHLRAALAGRYDVDREIGAGGMATVFLARDLRHDRRVALKVLRPELSAELGAERFLREVRVLARLSHPHILPLLDSGEAGGFLYYVMPFVEGESLRERLRREGELPLDDALRYLREVAEALGYAHAMGFVHRDIKPENILLQGGHALVADFGIARVMDGGDALTRTGLSIGTPLYMSPEQASGAATVDGRSDQYSLGCVAYELLTGEPPFTGPTPMAITSRKLTEALPPIRTRRSSVSPQVERALVRALERAPSDRFRTMQEFLEALAAPATDETAAPAGPRGRTGLIAAIATVAALAVGWMGFAERSRSTVAGDLSSVAVLPFEDLSPDSSQSYFAEGLADELVTSLSTVQGMRVASRTSTASLLRRGLDLRALSRELQVETALEGSVRVAANRIRVSTRLVQVADDRLLWSETYERPADDVLRIQEEIATSIVEAMRGRLHGADREALSSGTTDPEAYNLYLQGLALRRRQTEQALNRAAEYLRAAIDRAPDFARAHALLANTYAVQGWYDYRRPAEAFPAALDAAAAALRLEPRNATALATTAYATLYFKWDLPAAEQAFRRAIAADPNEAIAHQWYANYLAVAQRWDEAEREFQLALRLEPTSPVRHAVQVWVLTYRGEHARAVEAYRRAAQFDSSYATTFQWGAIALERAGLSDEAFAAMQRAVMLAERGPSVLAGLARLHALRGEYAEARRLLQEVTSARVVPAYDVAKAYLALGDRAEALRWLQRAYDERSHSMVFLRIDPQLESLRGDPAFEALARNVGV